MGVFQCQFLLSVAFTLLQSQQAVLAWNGHSQCRLVPNHTDGSQPLCSEYVTSHSDSQNLSDFGYVYFNKESISSCFEETKAIYYKAREGTIRVYLPNLIFYLNCSDCSCMVQIAGPLNTLFKTRMDGSFTENNTWQSINREDLKNDPVPLRRSEANVIRLVLSLKTISDRSVLNFTMQTPGYLDFHLNNRDFDLFEIHLSLSFYAIPDCARNLQTGSLSSLSGFIETYGWIDGKQYKPMTDSCVEIHVPEDQVLMISLVSFDVEDNYDFLILRKMTTSTREETTEYIQKAGDILPQVINDFKILSFTFKSDLTIEKFGFRLFYSFHKRSETPKQLSDGKWECNVSSYDSFKLHFECLPDVFCFDQRDKISCPNKDLCGHDLVTLGESCYRVFTFSTPTTWYNASDTCLNYGGRLAILNKASQRNKLKEYIEREYITTRFYMVIFVGLRMASSVNLPEIYRYTWLWSDNTLAVNVKISFDMSRPPYCAFIDDNYQTFVMTGCDIRESAMCVCETGFTPPNQTQDISTISLPAPSTTWNKNIATCRLNQTTHVFLACDVSTNCSAMNEQESVVCSSKFSPPVPFFECIKHERVPYTLVCDFRDDCCDGSDEDFCKFPACEGRMNYQCADSKQCILRTQLCDNIKDCVDNSDEMDCQPFKGSDQLSDSVLPPAQIDFTGLGGFTVTPLLNFSCPDSHFLCPGRGYCMPIYVRCNDVYDCPGREDEMGCDHYICPGFYRCRESKICLHERNLCDGVFQCPQHDDELMCNFTCPVNCHCYGYAFICSTHFTAEKYRELRYLDARDTGMKLEDLSKNAKLIHLNLRNCEITKIDQLNFPNLKSLDLSYNKLPFIQSSQLHQLENLIFLSLAQNPNLALPLIYSGNFRFGNIIALNVSGMMIQEIGDPFFNAFPNVQHLNLSNNALNKLPRRGFQSLHDLKILDLRGCQLNNYYYYGIFNGLKQLDTIFTDDYKLCCPSVLPEGMDSKDCHAPTDEVSSCDALLRTDVFRVFLALYAFMALTGNLGSFLYRIFIEECATKKGYEVFVTHLCVADFLMGVYLAIIGIADRIYLGNYQWNDTIWKHSAICKMAGFLSLVSSEVSAYLICLITLERFLVIGFPLKNLQFGRWSAHGACMVAWVIGLTLAMIPLLPVTSHWEFYSQSGICIPLPITRKQFDGSAYAFAIMIVVNFVLFIFIAFGQLLIYWFIRVNTFPTKNSKKKSMDIAIARRLLSVVITDFLCWFPIGLFGLMARSGVPISGKINVAMAIFVLPLNSALNPFLYTFEIVMERRRKIDQDKKSCGEEQKSCSPNTTVVFDVEMEKRKREKNNYSKEEAFQLFTKFIDEGLLTPNQVRHYVWDVYEG